MRDTSIIKIKQKLSMIHLMIFVVISSSFLTRIVQAAPVGSFSENDVMDEDPQTTTNAFIDDVIDMLRDLWGAQMDPLRIPRQKLSFEKSFIGFTIYGMFCVIFFLSLPLPLPCCKFNQVLAHAFTKRS